MVINHLRPSWDDPPSSKVMQNLLQQVMLRLAEDQAGVGGEWRSHPGGVTENWSQNWRIWNELDLGIYPYTGSQKILSQQMW